MDRPAGPAARRGPGRPEHRTGARGRPSASACPGRSPTTTGALAASAAPRCTSRSTPTGRTADRRGDYDSVYGDWGAVGDDARAVAAPQPPATRTGDVAAGARTRRRRPGGAARQRHERWPWRCCEADGADLDAVCALADDVRARHRRRRGHLRRQPERQLHQRLLRRLPVLRVRAAAPPTPDAYPLSLDEVADRVREAVALGATEICMQGGIDPELPASGYADLARAVKAAAPGVHLHAFSPMEVMNGVARTGAVRARLPGAAARGGRRHDPRHRGRDPRRRRAVGAHQGQAAGRRLGRRRHHRAPASDCAPARR